MLEYNLHKFKYNTSFYFCCTRKLENKNKKRLAVSGKALLKELYYDIQFYKKVNFPILIGSPSAAIL